MPSLHRVDRITLIESQTLQHTYGMGTYLTYMRTLDIYVLTVSPSRRNQPLAPVWTARDLIPTCDKLVLFPGGLAGRGDWNVLYCAASRVAVGRLYNGFCQLPLQTRAGLWRHEGHLVRQP